MDMREIAAMWAQHPDATTDASNDYAARSLDAHEAAERNARNVAALRAQAECGHCGRILDMRKRSATKHVIACEQATRPYAFGR